LRLLRRKRSGNQKQPEESNRGHRNLLFKLVRP
jgi:hypothetical protein